MPLGRVLIVDDEPHVSDVLRDALIDFGYEVEIAMTGLDALTLAPLYRPDVVVLDLFMPGMSGEVALQRFREFDPTVPVIIVSGNADEDLARATLAKGAFGYLQKAVRSEGPGTRTGRLDRGAGPSSGPLNAGPSVSDPQSSGQGSEGDDRLWRVLGSRFGRSPRWWTWRRAQS